MSSTIRMRFLPLTLVKSVASGSPILFWHSLFLLLLPFPRTFFAASIRFSVWVSTDVDSTHSWHPTNFHGINSGGLCGARFQIPCPMGVYWLPWMISSTPKQAKISLLVHTSSTMPLKQISPNIPGLRMWFSLDCWRVQ